MREPPAGDPDDATGLSADSPAQSAPLKKKTLSQHKVRTNVADRTLDSMFSIAPSSPYTSKSTGSSKDIGIRHEILMQESACFLDSILELRKRIERMRHRRTYLLGLTNNVL